MALVTIGDVTKEYPNGTTYLEIAEEYQPQYEDDILLVRINGKLRELHKKVKFDCRLEFFTGRDQPGIQTYHRVFSKRSLIAADAVTYLILFIYGLDDFTGMTMLADRQDVFEA